MSRYELLKLKLNNAAMGAYKHRSKLAFGVLIAFGLTELVDASDVSSSSSVKNPVQDLGQATSVKAAGKVVVGYLVELAWLATAVSVVYGIWMASEAGGKAFKGAGWSGVGTAALMALEKLYT